MDWVGIERGCGGGGAAVVLLCLVHPYNLIVTIWLGSAKRPPLHTPSSNPPHPRQVHPGAMGPPVIHMTRPGNGIQLWNCITPGSISPY